MSKKEETDYKRYLYRNFNILSKSLDNEKIYEDSWYDELIAYNNIMGTLIGLIDSKGKGDAFQDCKNFVLRYYEITYPEKQLREVDDALYSDDCYEYINYAYKNLIHDKTDLKILENFAKAYIKGYNLSRNISLKPVLHYYVSKIYKYNDKKNEIINISERLH